MGRRLGRVAVAALGLALLVGTTSCGSGGGRTAFVGVGNSGNHIFEDGAELQQLALALAAQEGTPEIGDEMLVEIFGSIVANARRGNPEAALIVFRLAAAQRGEDLEEDEG